MQESVSIFSSNRLSPCLFTVVTCVTLSLTLFLHQGEEVEGDSGSGAAVR